MTVLIQCQLPALVLRVAGQVLRGMVCGLVRTRAAHAGVPEFIGS